MQNIFFGALKLSKLLVWYMKRKKVSNAFYLFLVNIHKNSLSLNKINHITQIKMTKLQIKTKKHNYDEVYEN